VRSLVQCTVLAVVLLVTSGMLESGACETNGPAGEVWAFTEFNGRLVAGGTFDNADGNPARNIAIWDGVKWDSLGEGLDFRV